MELSHNDSKGDKTSEHQDNEDPEILRSEVLYTLNIVKKEHSPNLDNILYNI